MEEVRGCFRSLRSNRYHSALFHAVDLRLHSIAEHNICSTSSTRLSSPVFHDVSEHASSWKHHVLSPRGVLHFYFKFTHSINITYMTGENDVTEKMITIKNKNSCGTDRGNNELGGGVLYSVGRIIALCFWRFWESRESVPTDRVTDKNQRFSPDRKQT